MALGARGEAIIEADGREVRILYTNRALATAERLLDRSILGVLQGFSDGATRLSEVATLLRAGMNEARRDVRDGGHPYTMDDVYDVMDAVGFTQVTAMVMGAVADVIGYGAEPGGDESPNG